jgi:hypothetical protein
MHGPGLFQVNLLCSCCCVLFKCGFELNINHQDSARSPNALCWCFVSFATKLGSLKMFISCDLIKKIVNVYAILKVAA